MVNKLTVIQADGTPILVPFGGYHLDYEVENGEVYVIMKHKTSGKRYRFNLDDGVEFKYPKLK